jgi:hypothetical protein
MPSRVGARVVDARGALAWLGKDFGEDWVVPKAEVRYLVARGVGAATLLTAYGPDGQVLGDRLFPTAGEAETVMRGLRERGLASDWREIPDDAPSAREFLESGTRIP